MSLINQQLSENAKRRANVHPRLVARDDEAVADQTCNERGAAKNRHREVWCVEGVVRFRVDLGYRRFWQSAMV